MRDDKSDASPLDGAAGTVSQAAQTAGQIQKTVNQVIQGAGAAQKAAHTSQAAYAATASAQGGAAAAGATTGTALAGPLGTVVPLHFFLVHNPYPEADMNINTLQARVLLNWS